MTAVAAATVAVACPSTSDATALMRQLPSEEMLRERYSVTDLMDKLLEDIYRVGGGSVASESSTDQTNWSDGVGGNPIIPSGWSKRLARKSKAIIYLFIVSICNIVPSEKYDFTTSSPDKPRNLCCARAFRRRTLIYFYYIYRMIRILYGDNK